MKIEDVKIGMIVSHALCASGDRFQVVDILCTKTGLTRNKIISYSGKFYDGGKEYEIGDLAQHLASYLTLIAEQRTTTVASKYRF